MATLTSVEFAKQVCNYLQAQGCTADSNRWRNSPQILRALDVAGDQHNTGRSILKRMRKAGLLEMRGQGKYLWKLAVATWDQDNPFNTKIEKKSDEQSMKGCKGTYNAVRDEYLVKGETYDHREWFKANGFRWNSELEGWTIKADQQGKDAMIAGVLYGMEFKDPRQGATTSTSSSGASSEVVDALKSEIESLRAKVGDLAGLVGKTIKTEITVKLGEKKEIKLEERVHPVFEQVMFHLACGDNVMLVGPKGCGKTYLAEQCAKALNLDHAMISLSGGVTEGKLFGRSTPNITNGKSEFKAAPFAEMFEDGGLFLLDEVDAADPNVLLSLNSALANGKLALDRSEDPMVEKHDKFVCMAAANTWGNGADRQYVGRNQQDSAFTERFVQIAMDYDAQLEKDLCPGFEDMVETLQRYRANMMTNRVERTLSTRFILRAANWMRNGKDITYVEQMLFAGWRADEVRKVKGY